MNAKTAYEKTKASKNKPVEMLLITIENEIVDAAENGRFSVDCAVPLGYDEETVIGVVERLEKGGFRVNWYEKFTSLPYRDKMEYTISVSWREYCED